MDLTNPTRNRRKKGLRLDQSVEAYQAHQADWVGAKPSKNKNLARYIIRASFFQERMQYFLGPSKVVYRAKDRTEEKVFDALEWLVAMCSHIPHLGEQMVRYYGYSMRSLSYALQSGLEVIELLAHPADQ